MSKRSLIKANNHKKSLQQDLGQIILQYFLGKYV